MKLSTYIMCGAFVVGLVIAGLAAATSASSEIKKPRPLQLDGEMVDRSVPDGFSTIVFEQSELSTRYKINNYQGLKVEQSDSVVVPVLRASEPWLDILQVELKGDTLKITANPESMLEGYECSSGSCGPVNIWNNDIWPITVIVPQSTVLNTVASSTSSVQLQHFDTPAIAVGTASRLVLYDCAIDSLVCSGTVDELKIDRSTVKHLSIEGASANFNVNTCDGSGIIESMSFNR